MYKLNLAKFKNLRILLTNKYLIFINQNGIIKFNTNFYNFKIFDNILYLNLFKYNNDMNINLYFINIYYYLTYKKNELLLNYYKNYLITLYNNLYYLNYNYNFTIILKGVGYKFVDDNNFIKIRIGYSHFIEYRKDFDINEEVVIKLPRRATKGSAGYDCFAPIDIALEPGKDIKVPTGIRAYMKQGEVLMAFPRSGLGFKYYCRLANTVGIIDSDYYYSDNEGHIFVKLRNEGDKPLVIRQGEAMCQFIFVPFLLADGDSFERGEERNGGFGSTTK